MVGAKTKSQTKFIWEEQLLDPTKKTYVIVTLPLVLYEPVNKQVTLKIDLASGG